MKERNTGGLPEPSPSVLAALRGIHPGLYVIRSLYALEQSNGEVVHDPATREPVVRPRYWICIDHRGRKSLLFPVEDLEREYLPFDMRVVKRLGTDLGIITETADEMAAAMEAHDLSLEEKRKSSERDRFHRFIDNNGPAWREALENAKQGVISGPKRMRDPVIYGYNGQAVRSSMHNTIPMSAKERGIDVPEN